ncbi:MAG TPA: SAM-dependent methyltransferase [Patescibacteria group bacterium]|nr:SAM-dependent methyltransferase [Patescibacteria group bacterium]
MEILFLLLGIALLLFLGTLWLIWQLFWQLFPLLHGGGPFVPSQPEIVKKMVQLADLSPTDVVYDLGSGDGRILLQAVQTAGCRGVGYELYPRLVKHAREETHRLNLGDRLRFEQASFWHAPLGNATVVFLYQLSSTMRGLESKLLRELPSGAKVVSNAFIFPHWAPARTEGILRLYLKP